MALLHGGPSRLLNIGGYRYLWEYVAGLPTPLAWWQPKADSLGLWAPATIAESYVNVATPGTYNAAPGTAPAWAAATGWTFTAASSQYLTTGVIPANDQSYSLVVRFSGFGGTGWPAAALSAGGRIGVAPGVVQYWNGAAATAVAPALAAGTLAVCGARGYRDGDAEGAALAAWSGVSTRDIYLGAMNINGSPGNHVSAVITAVAVWNVDVSLYMAALHAALVAAGL